MLLVRSFDGVTDVIMGVVGDNTKSKYGKFRPWVLWTAIPLAVILSLTFTCPSGLGMTGKIVYAYVTYILFTLVYTANNIPYGALMAVMTGDDRERASIGSFRMAGAFAGGINGFFLWGDLPYTRGDWEGNKQVCREFAELTPYILTEEPDPEVTASESRKKLRHRCCRLGKIDTLVTVNVDERPIGTVTFTLPADRRDVKKVEVLFENREIAVRDGKFTDEFGALTRHVYRW